MPFRDISTKDISCLGQINRLQELFSRHKYMCAFSALSFLPSATKLRRLCFYTCLSFCPQGDLPQCMLGYPPGSWHPPGADTPPGSKPPPGRLLLRTVCILLECILFFSCRFEKVFDQQTKQDEIFDNVAKPVIEKWVKEKCSIHFWLLSCYILFYYKLIHWWSLLNIIRYFNWDWNKLW